MSSINMYFKNVLAIFLCLAVVSQAAFIDTIKKCKSDDDECFKNFLQNFIVDLPKEGLPEWNIPSIDPVHVTNVTVDIADIAKMTIIDGVAKGVKKTIVNRFAPNFDKQKAELDITASITLKGQYDVSTTSPVLKTLFNGENVHGKGKGKIVIDKVNLKLTIPYDYEVRGDDVFVVGKSDKIEYTFDILGNVLFAADNIFIGDKESSADVVKLVNENWRLLVGSFGKQFIDIAMNYVFENSINKFLGNFPSKNYVIDDLRTYAKQ